MAENRTVLNRFLDLFESRLSLVITLGGAMTSFAVPAWTLSLIGWMSEYSPFSWVVAGFAGLLAFSVAYALVGFGRAKWVRAKYDTKMGLKGSFVDPMAKIYENKRIYLNDFCLPSHPLIDGKAFINCEIIGPSNVVLDFGNQINDPQYPICDAVLLDSGRKFFNGIIIRNCTFRHCSFQRVTFLTPSNQYALMSDWNVLNWISVTPQKTSQVFEHVDGQKPPEITG